MAIPFNLSGTNLLGIGHWGYHSDQSDQACMMFDEVVDKIVKKRKFDGNEQIFSFVQQKLKQANIWNRISHLLLKSLESKKLEPAAFVGCVLTMLKSQFNLPIQSQPFHGSLVPPSLPNKLNKFIPEPLQRTCITILEQRLTNTQSTLQIQALESELWLFSNGALGKNNGVINGSPGLTSTNSSPEDTYSTIIEAINKLKATPLPKVEPVNLTCSTCGGKQAKMICSRCLLTRYCDPLCQKQHWLQHKLVCQKS